MRHHELAPLPCIPQCVTNSLLSLRNLAHSLPNLSHYKCMQTLLLLHHHHHPASPQQLMALSMSSIILPLSLSFLLLCHSSLAQIRSSQTKCRIDHLSAQEPTRRFESEAGHTEFYNERNEQFDCAGVAAQRRVIQPRGLLLPSFLNAPRLVYIVQGRGISGTIVPGCPESFQQFQGQQQQQQQPRRMQTDVRDQHQRINRFIEGDMLAIPAGVAHWAYNDGEQPIVAVTVLDTSNNANQLDSRRREFLLAGSKQRGQRFTVEPYRKEDSGNNILSGFDTETLAEVMGISRQLAEKIKGQNDNRGEIVRVQEEFRVLRPSRSQERGEYEYEEERERTREVNGLEQTSCSMRIKENIEDPHRADYYNPNGGRLTSLNSQKLPILRYLKLSAERAVLYRNAFIAPHWNVNAHAIVYVTRGSGRIQVVNNQGNKVHDSQLRQGQILVIPQNFAVLTQARSEGFEYVTFYTNDNAIVNPIVGKNSAFKGMPEEVLMNSFRVSRDEARRLKFNRGEEMHLFSQRSIGIRSYA